LRTIKDFVNRCAAGARNHGDFVCCVAHLTDDLRSGNLGGAQKKARSRARAAHAK